TRHRRRHARHSGDRPLLVPLRLLPRAERRALRAGDAWTGVRHRRGSGAPRREADPPSGVRAPPTPGRAGADAAARPARRVDDVAAGTEPLVARWREAAAEPAGALVLLHGRGADENDLFSLLDLLDPERRLV